MPTRKPSGHPAIQVKPSSKRKFIASCPIKGCRETRTMDTETLAWQAIAGHVGAKHEIYAYLH